MRRRSVAPNYALSLAVPTNAEATRVVDAIVDAGEDAAIRAVQAWCVANPGAKHVDVIAERVAAAKTRGAA